MREKIHMTAQKSRLVLNAYIIESHSPGRSKCVFDTHSRTGSSGESETRMSTEEYLKLGIYWRWEKVIPVFPLPASLIAIYSTCY